MEDKYFDFEGKQISMDYYCVKDNEEIQEIIRSKYKKDGFRNFPNFQKWLRDKYTGNLPKEAYNLAKYFGFQKFVYDLFLFDESEYRAKHPKEVKSFFEDLPFKEQKKIFQGTDGGGRNIIEYMQDVLVGNLFERMLVYHSNINGTPALKVNEEASNFNVVNTKPDLIYEITHHDEHISIPIEVKTGYIHSFKKPEHYDIEMRGNAKNVINDKGMVFKFFLNVPGFKGVVIDTVDHPFTRGIMKKSKKECDIFTFTEGELFDCTFWKEEYMRELLNRIYKLYRERK